MIQKQHLEKQKIVWLEKQLKFKQNYVIKSIHLCEQHDEKLKHKNKQVKS